MREVKTLFSSTIEVYTLKLTEPTPQLNNYASYYSELLHALETHLDDPLFVATIVSKISRKINEDNVFTKLKSLFLLHKLILDSRKEAATAIVSTILASDETKDNIASKLLVGSNSIENRYYWNAESVHDIEMIDFLKTYQVFVKDCILLMGQQQGILRGGDALHYRDTLKSMKQQGNKLISTEEKNSHSYTFLYPVVDACIEQTKASMHLCRGVLQNKNSCHKYR
jgi:hypothetical protein